MKALVVTRSEMAEAARIPVARVARFLTGESTPDVNEAARLAYSLGVSIGELTTAGSR